MANFDVTTGQEITLDRVFRSPLEDTCRKFFAPVVRDLASSPEVSEAAELFQNAFDNPEFVFVPRGMRFSIARALPHALQGLSADGFERSFDELAPVLDPRSVARRLWSSE